MSESSLTDKSEETRWSLREVDFGRGAVSTIDGGGLGGGRVGEEPIVEQLMNDFAGSMDF